MKFPPPQCLAVDVDHTLVHQGVVSKWVVDKIIDANSKGLDVILWSMRGREYAEGAARYAGISDLVICVSKPGFVIDDQGLQWTKTCRVLRPHD